MQICKPFCKDCCCTLLLQKESEGQKGKVCPISANIMQEGMARMPQHKQLISIRQKPHPQPSPIMMSTASSQLEPRNNPDLEENEEESTTILPIDIFDGQYHEVNPGQYNETNPGHPCQIRVSMDGDSLLMKGCSRPVPRSEPGPVPREEPRPIRGT